MYIFVNNNMHKRKRGSNDDINALSKKMCKIKLKRKRDTDDTVINLKRRRLTEVEIISLVEKDVLKDEPKEASKEELRYLLGRMCEMNLRLRGRNKVLKMQNDVLRSRVDSPLALCDIKHIEVI
jgi:hypothetical protein